MLIINLFTLQVHPIRYASHCGALHSKSGVRAIDFDTSYPILDLGEVRPHSVEAEHSVEQSFAHQ